jgi:hypothetical protein
VSGDNGLQQISMIFKGLLVSGISLSCGPDNENVLLQPAASGFVGDHILLPG